MSIIIWLNLKSWKEETKIYTFLHKKISKSANSLIKEEHSYENKKINYYGLPKSDYYELDIFNQPKDFLKVFYVQSHTGHKCWFCRYHFLSNNKLYNHL